VADNARRRTICRPLRFRPGELPLTLPKLRTDANHVFHQHVIRLAERDALRDWLLLRGSVPASITRSICSLRIADVLLPARQASA
jgi:hypothetical protein